MASSVSAPNRRNPDPHHASAGADENKVETISATAEQITDSISHRGQDRRVNRGTAVAIAVNPAHAAAQRNPALWGSNGLSPNVNNRDGHVASARIRAASARGAVSARTRDSLFGDVLLPVVTELNGNIRTNEETFRGKLPDAI